LSRAYLTICPFNKANHKIAEEQKNNSYSYQVDTTKQTKKTKFDLVRDKIRGTLIDCGYPSAKVDEVLKGSAQIPD